MQDLQEPSVVPLQFFCTPETVLKNNINLKRSREGKVWLIMVSERECLRIRGRAHEYQSWGPESHKERGCLCCLSVATSSLISASFGILGSLLQPA